jgi:hypothetical protein
MASTPHPIHSPNSKRVEAGRRNWLKRRGLTPEGAEKLRQSALTHKPWAYSTGPRTPAGKDQARRNGKTRQKGHRSVREVRQLLAQVQCLTLEMAAGRGLVERG